MSLLEVNKCEIRFLEILLWCHLLLALGVFIIEPLVFVVPKMVVSMRIS